MRPLIPLPNCETCGTPVKDRWRTKGVKTRFCSNQCVPRWERAKNGRQGRLRASLKHRVAKHRAHLKRLQALPTITGEDLLATFEAISRQEYQRGYCACQAKWLWKQQQKGKAA